MWCVNHGDGTRRVFLIQAEHTDTRSTGACVRAALTFRDHACRATNKKQEARHGEVTSFWERAHPAACSCPPVRHSGDVSPGLRCLLSPPPPPASCCWTSPGSASSSGQPGTGAVWRSGGQRRGGGGAEWLSAWTADRKERRSIFTSLWPRVCALWV